MGDAQRPRRRRGGIAIDVGLVVARRKRAQRLIHALDCRVNARAAAAICGGDLGWIPNPTLGGGGLILAIEASRNFVYVGGVFSNIGGRARNNLAKLSATSGNAVSRFRPDPDDAVFALVRSGRALYAGGEFNNIGGQNRAAVARMHATTGNITAFNVWPTSSRGPRAAR